MQWKSEIRLDYNRTVIKETNMEVVIIGLLSILATCGWWVLGVWGLEGLSCFSVLIFGVTGGLTWILIEIYCTKITTFLEGE